MIFRPALRSDEPVWVRSTIASTMSGIFASVAPCDVNTRASMPRSAKKRRVVSGISVDTRTPAGRSAADSHGDSRGTAKTTLTADSPARPPPKTAGGGGPPAPPPAAPAGADDIGARLGHPVATGDAEVEDALLDVR